MRLDMGLVDKITQALTVKPLAKAVSKFRASSAGTLYTEQAVSRYDAFFDNLMRVDTDETLRQVGMQRHQLSTLLYDDEIDEKVERRIENLTQASYTLSPSEGDEALFVYDQLNKHLESLVIASMNAKLYGYSVCEIVWDKETYKQTGIMQPLRLTEKPMQWFEPKNDGRLLFFADDMFAPVEVDTKYKYLLQQHRATFDNPKGKALLSRIYWLWYFKKNGWKFWSKFLERFGSPLLIGTTTDDPTLMASALAQAHSQSIFTMPDGDSVNTISSSGNGETFKAYDDAINKRIAKYLLGQTLTSGADGGGTYGQGKVHQEQQEIIFNSDKMFATRYIRQFINLICELNGIEEAPWFNFKPEKGIQDELANRDVKLTNQGVEFTRKYYEDTYDIESKYIKTVGVPVKLNKLPDDTAMASLASNLMAATTTFTPEQEQLEKLSEYALNSRTQPIDPKAVLSIVKASKDADELTERLFDMVGNNLDESDFTALVAAVNQAADIHGMVDETLGN